MVALWISLDNINCSSCTLESSLCTFPAGMVSGRYMPHCFSYGNFLFIQPSVLGFRAPCSPWSAPASLSRHGQGYFGWVSSLVIAWDFPVDIISRNKRGFMVNFTGPRWGRYFVGPIQFGLCYGAVIACILLGGQSLKVSFLFPSRLSKTCRLFALVKQWKTGTTYIDLHNYVSQKISL